MAEEKVTILNKAGLHARTASVFVHEASKFKCLIRVKRAGNSGWINGKSILGMLTLGLITGSQMVINTEGRDAEVALAALVNLVENRFGEEDKK